MSASGAAVAVAGAEPGPCAGMIAVTPSTSLEAVTTGVAVSTGVLVPAEGSCSPRR